MASYVLPASRAGTPSVVTTATATGTYVVALNAVIAEAGSGGSSGGAGTTSVRVMVMA